jgi:hypothetical protein
MDHEMAVKTQAVEQYFLGEMKPEDREAFEEHFFSCELCAMDVRATSAFVDNAKAILNGGQQAADTVPKRSQSPGWFASLRPTFTFAAAAALCLAVIGYQNFVVIPGLKAPQGEGAPIIFDGPTRSALPVLHQGESLHFEMPWDKRVPAFVELRHDSKTVSKGEVPAPAPNQPLEVYIPGKLKPGRYSVVVRPEGSASSDQGQIEDDFEVIP